MEGSFQCLGHKGVWVTTGAMELQECSRSQHQLLRNDSTYNPMGNPLRQLNSTPSNYKAEEWLIPALNPPGAFWTLPALAGCEE